jgi:outer membrane protein assembly factor BamB
MHLLASLLLALPTAAAQDAWPTHLGDARRSGAVPAGPTPPLALHWTHASPHAPRPAWGDPARGSYWQRLDELEPRVTFDKAFQPVAVEDAVYYASSVDDQVRCLDLATGALRWRAFADGPLRFAPALAGDRLYVGGDDGCLRAFDRRDGAPLWTARCATG